MMLKQQITPWSIYENFSSNEKRENRSKEIQLERSLIENSPKLYWFKRANENPENMGELSSQIQNERSSIREEIHKFLAVKIIRNQLCSGQKNANHISLKLPNLKSPLGFKSLRRHKFKDHKSHKSQKMLALDNLSDIQQISKIFVKDERVMGSGVPQFPKNSRKSSILAETSSIASQFDDRSISQKMESPIRRKNSKFASRAYNWQK